MGSRTKYNFENNFYNIHFFFDDIIIIIIIILKPKSSWVFYRFRLESNNYDEYFFNFSV